MPEGLPDAAYKMIRGRFSDEQEKASSKPALVLSPTASGQDKLLVENDVLVAPPFEEELPRGHVHFLHDPVQVFTSVLATELGKVGSRQPVAGEQGRTFVRQDKLVQVPPVPVLAMDLGHLCVIRSPYFVMPLSMPIRHRALEPGEDRLAA